ncbi:MAG TPA: hypothetical protein VJ397_04095 [Thermoplasmata archaeon]|nr:hypothetical protein [Thermoplasmata archaeon]
MRILASDAALLYVQMEEAADIDAYQVRSTETHENGFEFFRGLGIIGYDRTFKMWLRKFPRPIFLATVKGREVQSWIFVEESTEAAKDGFPLFILRAVETLPAMRRKRVGYRLLLLACALVSGYLLVKPLTKDAARFFTAAGFVPLESVSRPPVPASRMPGYMILLPHKRKELVDSIPANFTTIVTP